MKIYDINNPPNGQNNYYKQIRIGPYTTSKIEIIDLLKSWVAISIAFGILYGGEIGITAQFITAMIIAAITVGSAFLLHELAHKIAAQHYGCYAEYRSSDFMLLLAIIMSFTGFVFFAPGAVLISGPVGKKRNGIISLAGPMTNFALAVLFLMIQFFVEPEGVIAKLAQMGVQVNSFIGLFNLIPFFIFDGKKIWDWNKAIWIASVILGILLLFGNEFISTLIL